MIQKHCFECGTALIEKELEEEGIVPYCPKCQQYRFPMYNVAVSMIVVDEETGKILLIQQYGKPSYILVAGYVNRGEAEEHAVVREVREETGLEVEHLRFNAAYQPRSGPLQVVHPAGSQRKHPSQQPCSGIFECVSGRSGE